MILKSQLLSRIWILLGRELFLCVTIGSEWCSKVREVSTKIELAWASKLCGIIFHQYWINLTPEVMVVLKNDLLEFACLARYDILFHLSIFESISAFFFFSGLFWSFWCLTFGVFVFIIFCVRFSKKICYFLKNINNVECVAFSSIFLLATCISTINVLPRFSFLLSKTTAGFLKKY